MLSEEVNASWPQLFLSKSRAWRKVPHSHPKPALTWTSALKQRVLVPLTMALLLLQQGDDLRLGDLIPHMKRKTRDLCSQVTLLPLLFP